jgi:hypothetical protein
VPELRAEELGSAKMRVGLILLKAAVTSVVFVIVYWIFNSIWGDGQGFTAGNAIAAVISGLIFFLIYSLATYLYERNKSKRST